MNERSILTLAIIAFDLMLKDCIEHDRNNEKFHPSAIYILKMLQNMLQNSPQLNYAQEQYLINVSEISAEIKNIFLGSTPTEEDLNNMLKIQSERLAWLNDKINTPQHNLH